MVIPIKFDNVSRARWQRNLPKNVLHVQSFCFAWLIELASSVTVHAKQYLIRDDFVWKIDDFIENARRKRVLQVSIETESLSSANRPPRACFFSIIAIFIGITSWSLCGGTTTTNDNLVSRVLSYQSLWNVRAVGERTWEWGWSDDHQAVSITLGSRNITKTKQTTELLQQGHPTRI